jgi:signal transduction histidine kinase
MLENLRATVEPVEVALSQRARAGQVLQWVVLVILGGTVVVYLAALALALGWMRRPFLGAFLESTLVFNNIRSQGNDQFPAFSEGLRAFDHLLALNDGPVLTEADLNAKLENYAPGQVVRLKVAHQSGGEAQVSLTLRSFPLPDQMAFFVTPYLIGVFYLGAALWVFRMRGNETAGRAFAVFCAVVALTLGCVFDFYTTHRLVGVWTFSFPAIGATAASLGLVFPQEIGWLQKRPGLRLLVCYAPVFALAFYTLFVTRNATPWAYLTAWTYQNVFMGVGIVTFLVMLGYRWLFSGSPVVRQQSRVILIGALIAASFILFHILQQTVSQALGREAFPFNAFYFVPTVFLPISIAFAIWRYRLIDADRRLARAVIYGTLAVLTLLAYALIVTGASLALGTTIGTDNPIVIGLLVFSLVALFNPFREWMQRRLDETFFRGSRSYAQRIEQFGRALTRSAGLDDIVAELNGQIHGALKPAHLHVFMRDLANDDFAAFADAGQRATTDLRFMASGALAATLARDRSAILLTPDQPLPDQLLRDRARLAVLGSAVYVPLISKTLLSGWLAIGPKLSGEPFTRDDIEFIEVLADQSALAIERATVISDLERRVTELNVLGQMSQAVNFTTTYDDLLELIFAQTSKVLDTRNFYIILKDPRGRAFNYAFYVENNERVPAEEHKPWPADRGLAAEIVRLGQPIRTDDYHAECRRRNVVPRPKQYRAWMGVPLNAGPETIGIMNVAAYTSEVAFTDDQLKVFSALADQAASAIVKARLYRQTEQRARQLATLNEVSTSMSSTLELDPLLQRIIQSSADILDCEAGSLFLTDDETGEYVFRVAVGPVGQNLVGMRIAPGKGFVGEAIESGAPLLVNDVQNDPRWFKGADQSSGFITHALMVVPLRFQARPIGAVEVINKRDGTPFNEDDQNILTAFSGQAAVAIQNAKLFTMTDQALAERVEELSVMQRIDRELNTELDVKRVMGITLDWAILKTGATAGSVGIVGETTIAIIATQGYGDSAPPVGMLPREKGLLGRVVTTGEIALVRGGQAEPDTQRLASTRTQLVIPIMSEQKVVGLVNLESPDPEAFTEEQVAFVTRLVDHASVAITNARLYAEVHAANIAKSEFVSFVAHELKTPMTSIRGYTDLLNGSAVGPVNDMQKQFLTTIRGNVDRMATLVSDLADIARIESGRLRLEPKAFPFQNVIDDVVHTTQALIDAKKQTLVQEIEPNLPDVWADHTRAVQVLTNLMSNAYKYTPESGQIVLHVAKETNQWDPDGAPEVLHIAVQDTGIGIAPEDQKKLFQKFFRAEDRMAREMAPGTGLGLNIVKNLVELQGGQIWFESEFRKGSTFHFTVPVATEEDKVSA